MDEAATAVAKEAHETAKSVYDPVLSKGWTSRRHSSDDILKPRLLTQPRHILAALTGGGT